MRSVFTKTSPLGCAAFAVVALAAPAVAQSHADTLHAELGTLRSVEVAGNQHLITIAVPSPSDGEAQRSYRATETTGVEGLGAIMTVSDITERSHGSIVVVTYARDGQELVAENIRFTGGDEIRVTQGTVVEVDQENETLVVEAEGERQRLDLDQGYGATVDSQQGLISPEDLSAGQQVTVYYSAPQELQPLATDDQLTGHAWLIVQSPS